jgi:hypothetical protein
MKRIFLFFLAITLTGSAFAQGFYIRAGGTYGVPVGTADIGDRYNYIYDYTGGNASTGSAKAVLGSYGAGPNFSVAVGYKFNQNFMFDLGAQYLIGNKYKTSSYYQYKYSGYTWVDSDFYDTHARGLFVNPSFVFSVGFGKAAPYGRFGVVVGFPRMTQNTWYPGQSNLTKYTNNGQDVLPNQSVSQIQTNYLKNLNPFTTQDSAKPSEETKISMPLSSVSVNVGLRFTMFQKKDE